MNNQEQEVKPTLLNCPFCGSEPTAIIQRYKASKFIMCQNCQSNTQFYSEAEEAIKSWNRRTPPIVTDKEVEKEWKPREIDQEVKIIHLKREVEKLKKENEELKEKLANPIEEDWKDACLMMKDLNEENSQLEQQLAKAKISYEAALDSAEFSWSVICNVGGGDWSPQSGEWLEAARLARNTYYKARDLRLESVDDTAESPTPNREEEVTADKLKTNLVDFSSKLVVKADKPTSPSDSELLDSGMICFKHPEDEWGCTSTLHKGLDLRSCIRSAMEKERNGRG